MKKEEIQKIIEKYEKIKKNGWELTLEQETLLLLLKSLLDPSLG